MDSLKNVKTLLTQACVFGFVAGLFGLSQNVWACASCGSGGDDPMILYPSERWKAYVGFSRTGDFESLDSGGEVTAEYGPLTRNTSVVSLGHSFTPQWFATVSAPYIVNKREEYERSGWGDPLLSTRYTVLPQNISDEWIPQVQLMASYRPGDAPSAYDYEDTARLDVRGTGFPEARAGVDVWQGLFNWKGGLAQSVSYPIGTRDTEFGSMRPGVTYRSTVTAGYGWGDSVRVMGGLNRDYITAKHRDGAKIDDSETLSHGTFLTADAKVERLSMVRLTLSRAANVFQNRNVSRSETVTLAVMRSF